MIRRILSAIKYLYTMFYAYLYPVGYARAIGVRMGTNVVIYGMASRIFGSEPWLITLGDNVYITSGCEFVTHDGGTLILRKEVPDLELTAPITVGNDVYFGINTIVLPGVTIGNRVIIGAGSVVTKDIPDNSVAVGVPARVIKTVDAYLERASQRSLHLGHLYGEEKARALKAHFGVKD